MSRVMLVFLLIMSSVYVTGCNQSEDNLETTIVIGNPDAKETLSLDPNADIFQWEGVIYKTDIEWVNELTLTKKEELGMKEEASSEGSTYFKNKMANKLPIGAKVYSSKERNDSLMVESKDKEKYYLALVE